MILIDTDLSKVQYSGISGFLSACGGQGNTWSGAEGIADSAKGCWGGAGSDAWVRYPRERDSLAVRPFAGTRARLGTFTVPTPATDSTPPQATPAGEPSPADVVSNVSAHRGEVA